MHKEGNTSGAYIHTHTQYIHARARTHIYICIEVAVFTQKCNSNLFHIHRDGVLTLPCSVHTSLTIFTGIYNIYLNKKELN